MQRLRQYLLDYPEEQNEIFSYNESYVFFRFLEEGPLGNLEVPLTPGRSLATDWRLFPKGALAFIITQMPVVDAAGQLVGWQSFARFVLNQDTGGAIRGPQRADLYFGTGFEAEAGAGYMNGRELYLSEKSCCGPSYRKISDRFFKPKGRDLLSEFLGQSNLGTRGASYRNTTIENRTGHQLYLFLCRADWWFFDQQPGSPVGCRTHVVRHRGFGVEFVCLPNRQTAGDLEQYLWLSSCGDIVALFNDSCSS